MNTLWSSLLSRFSKTGITGKLFLAILALCVLTALAMGFATRISFQQGFANYLLELEQNRISFLKFELEEEYALRGNWNFVHEERAWRRFLHRFSRPGDEQRLKESGKKTLRETLSLAERTRRYWENAHLRSTLGLLLPDKKTLVAGHRPIAGATWLALTSDGTTVGWLTREPIGSVAAAVDLRFHEEQLTAFILIMLLGIALAAVAALLMAKTLITPIKRLADTSNRLATGDFTARVSPAPPAETDVTKLAEEYDELAVLAGQFNAMAAALEEHEQARRTFMAEIAHDLRTPLAVLRGEIEALEDGVRPVNAESLHSLSAEVEMLGRLIDDIHTLSLADLGKLQYEKTSVDLTRCLALILSSSEDRIAARSLSLESHLPDGVITICADSARITQVIRNVIENSMRYTDAGGKIVVSCREEAGEAIITVCDTAPGVPDAELPRLFERFHTGDPARNRKYSGSGLGLAICRTLMQAHGGDIRALQSPLGGLQVRINLPTGPCVA